MRPVYLISKTSYPGVIHIPILTIQFLHPDIDFSLYNGLIVTSKQGAMALQGYEMDWNSLEILCVGEETAKEIKRLGAIHVSIAEGYGDSIAQKLIGSDKKWLYLRPKQIASSWPERVRELGVKVDEEVIYQTRCNDALDSMEVDTDGILIFTSPSSIECFLKRYCILPTHRVIVIGKTTQKALPPSISSDVSKEPSIEACVVLALEIGKDSSPF